MDNVWNLLFNKDTIDAWISVFGAFLGTFLAGLVSVLIAKWTFNKQNAIQNEEISKNREKGIQMIEEFVDLAISCLILISPGPNGVVSSLNDNMAELKKLKDINSELSNIPNELISIDINVPFQNIRILLKILSIEIEKVLTQQYESEDKLARDLKKVEIDRRLLKIVEYLKSFSSKQDLDGLYEDLHSTQL